MTNTIPISYIKTCQNTYVRRGIFGGTFDPIHFGHIHAIAHSIFQANIEAIHVMVAGEPYQKENLMASAKQRLDWVNMAVGQFFPDNEIVKVDDREVFRDGPTYTIDSIKEIKAEFPEDELILVVGEDIVETIDTWKDSRQVQDLVEVFVVPRSIFPTSSSYIRAQLQQKRPITGLIPNEIEAEIVEKSLYN